MTWSDEYNQFLQMENDLNLFEMEICGVKFWERIRFQIYTAITIPPTSSSQIQPDMRTGFARLRRLIPSIVYFHRNPLLAPKSSLLFICSPRRILENDGFWWDIYTDPIINSLSVPPVSIEAHFNNIHHKPAKTRDLRYFDAIELITYLMTIMGFAKVHLNEEEIRRLNNIRSEIRRRFGIDIDVLSRTRRLLEDRKARLPLYRRMLKRIKPKVVMLAQGYQWEDLIEVSKSLGIKTVELQHGIINPFHVAYSYSGISRKKETFADYLLSWGDHWKSIVEYPISKKHVVSTGFPYIEMKRSSYSMDIKKKQILFISQGLSGDRISEFAVALSKSPEIDYRIVYKLHPLERVGWKKNYPELVTSDVVVIDNLDVRLHDLFAESVIQVGVCSTALYEGLVFGLHTYLIDAPGIEIMAPLIEGGFVEKVSTPDELVKCIRECNISKQFDAEVFFKKNAVENIISFLRNL